MGGALFVGGVIKLGDRWCEGGGSLNERMSSAMAERDGRLREAQVFQACLSSRPRATYTSRQALLRPTGRGGQAAGVNESMRP